MAENNVFPLGIQRLLEKKGYFKLTKEQRNIQHYQSLNKLKKIPHVDYGNGREALKELKGE